MPHPQSKHLHFLGIAGYAIRGITLAAQQLGYTVTGTDPNAYPPGSDWLDQHHITWYRQPSPDHLNQVDQLIINPQISPKDPEIQAAQHRNIPIISWAELVQQLTIDKHRIVVSGTHGKSTTTTLITWLLQSAGQQPDFLIGAQPRHDNNTVKITKAAPVIVLEGDEYIASQLEPRSKFLYYHPSTLVITSIEMDHPDIFQDFTAMQDAYAELINQLPPQAAVVHHFSSQPQQLTSRSDLQFISYGQHRADYSADQIHHSPQGLQFTIHRPNQAALTVTAPLYGQHNIDNILAASAVAQHQGLSDTDLIKGLQTFPGVKQRFDLISIPDKNINIINDYAHHPTAVATTLQAAKQHFNNHGRVIAVYRPHTYSRTKELLSQYQSAFQSADLVFLAEIEPAREKDLSHTISSQHIADLLPQPAIFTPDRTSLLQQIKDTAQPGDTIVIMTVSGYQNFAQELERGLEGREEIGGGR